MRGSWQSVWMMEFGPKVGMEAPRFILVDASESNVDLEKELARGPMLLVFYPNDFGVICSVEMRMLNDILLDLESRGIGVLAISTNSTYTHRRWKESLGISFRLLADTEGAVSKRYAGLQESGILQGRPRRALFLLDRRGIIRYRWVAEAEGLLPPLDEMMAATLALNSD
jgi:peroxiredoxin